MLSFFKRKPPSQLIEALNHIKDAEEIITAHKRDKTYIPSQKDLALLARIEENLYHNYAYTSYVHRCLSQRKSGEPEGAKKFTDPEVFDYHYPP